MSLLAAAALAGCGGGSDGAPGATGATGPAGPAGATGATGAPGANLVAKSTVGSNTVTATAASAAAWKSLAPQVTISSVTIASAPVVTFTVKDAAGNAVVGLGNKAQSATATVANLTNLGFTLAKLVPGTNGAPSKWVSYNVLKPVTVAQAAGTIAASDSCNKTATAAATWCGTFPTTDTQGTLVDNGDGSYKYTFYRDPKQVASLVAGLTDSVDGLSKKADLGDVSFDATATHRLGIIISGNAPGTGTNTPTAATSPMAAVAMVNPANAYFDFRPDGAAVTATRNIVKIESCAACHDSKPLAHGGARKDPQFCVTCHTDQVKYSFNAGDMQFAADGVTIISAPATASTAAKRAAQAILHGRAVGNFPNYIHKLHMAKGLVNKGYNYNNDGGAMMFNEVTYPQFITNCVKCHDGSTNAVSKTPVTADGDNWKKVPSALACGSCHDGINFATGRGTALGDTGKYIGGHVGGAQADDSKCTLCHTVADIPVYHVTVDPTGSSGRAGYPVNTAQDVPTVGFPSGQGPSIPLASQLGNLPAGVFKINFEIKQATVSGAAGAKKATVIYRILKDGAPVTLNSTGYLMTNVDGTPSIYVAYAVPQDGIAAPADWNASASATVLQLRDKLSGNTQTGPDASGYYTATLAATIPDAAKMVTAAIGINYQGFVQLGHAAFPKGIRLREPQFVTKLADGFTARRAIVANTKCNSCHGQLGVEPSFHGGARNNGEGCAICHNANNSTGHTGAAYSFGGGWNVGIKNLVHSIHSSSKRAQAFTYEATLANPNGFKEVGYPGRLTNCEQCHVTGSYDFSAAANAAAVPNLLWTTDAKTDMSNPTNAATLGLSPWITSLGRGQTSYTTDNLVTSPVTSACFGCHDSAIAVSHYQLNGGTVYGSVSAVSTGGARPAVGASTGFGFTKVESCMVCHAPGKVGDIRAMHMN